MAFKPIKITLTFNQRAVQGILKAATFGGKAPNAATMSEEAHAALAKELQATAGNFVWEIVDTSDEACANDWLATYMRRYFPQEEE